MLLHSAVLVEEAAVTSLHAVDVPSSLTEEIHQLLWCALAVVVPRCVGA
jgi:hypothetical protein